MDTFPLVVSYYTKETFYQFEVENLIASCEKWGIEHRIEGIDSLGSWELNCCFKPYFLYQMLEKLQRPLFWVDADAIFVKKPTLFKGVAADLAVRINSTFSPDHPSRVMSGSLYVNATEGGRRALLAWAKGCYAALSDPKRETEVWDQIVLRGLIEKEYLEPSSGIKIAPLPEEYTYISDNEQDKSSICSPVICHFQASRRFKKFINFSTTVS